MFYLGYKKNSQGQNYLHLVSLDESLLVSLMDSNSIDYYRECMGDYEIEQLKEWIEKNKGKAQ
jgi:hypothetical protein